MTKLLHRLLVVFAVSFLASAHSVCAATEPDWKLCQKSKLNGTSMILVTPKAIRIDNEQRKISIIARAPTWQLWVCNLKSKTYIKIPLNHWRGPFSATLDVTANGYYSTAPVRPTGKTEIIGGIATRHYGMKAQPSVRRDESQIFQIDYWVAQNLNTPEELCTILRRYHKLPEAAHGLPMRMTYLDMDGTTVELETVSARRWQTTASAFVAPAGLKLMPKPEDVMLSTGSLRNMQYMIDAFDSLREPTKR